MVEREEVWREEVVGGDGGRSNPERGCKLREWEGKRREGDQRRRGGGILISAGESCCGGCSGGVIFTLVFVAVLRRYRLAFEPK